MTHSLFHSPEQKEKTLSTVVSVLIVICASALLAISTSIFLNPAGLYAGGVTGFAQIILHFLGVFINGKEGWNSLVSYLGYLNFAFLLPFNLLAWFKLSKKYAIYTLLSSIVQSVVLAFASPLQDIGIFKDASGDYNVLACATVAAVIGGVCNGVLMRRGATSGGFITLCQYLNLKKGKSVGSINLIVSSTIMICGATANYFSTSDESLALGAAISTALYTLFNFTLDNLVIDYVHTVYNKVKLEIVTEKGEEISEQLLEHFPHGITITKGVGAYSKHDKYILNAVVSKYETNYYFRIVKEIDPECFISILPCNGIFGKFNTIIINK